MLTSTIARKIQAKPSARNFTDVTDGYLYVGTIVQCRSAIYGPTFRKSVAYARYFDSILGQALYT